MVNGQLICHLLREPCEAIAVRLFGIFMRSEFVSDHIAPEGAFALKNDTDLANILLFIESDYTEGQETL